MNSRFHSPYILCLEDIQSHQEGLGLFSDLSGGDYAFVTASCSDSPHLKLSFVQCFSTFYFSIMVRIVFARL